jgi:hypothetical protein
MLFPNKSFNFPSISFFTAFVSFSLSAVSFLSPFNSAVGKVYDPFIGGFASPEEDKLKVSLSISILPESPIVGLDELPL